MNSARKELDKLLNFYDAYKPQMAGKEIGVYLTATTLKSFAKKDTATDLFSYRGYWLKPLKQSKATA